jgi:hypothetical protein
MVEKFQGMVKGFKDRVLHPFQKRADGKPALDAVQAAGEKEALAPVPVSSSVRQENEKAPSSAPFDVQSIMMAWPSEGSVADSSVETAMSEELRRSLEDVIIDPQTQAMIDAFLSQYGDTPYVGVMRGYAYHGAQEHPLSRHTGREILDLLMEEFKREYCKHPSSLDPSAESRYLAKLLDTVRMYSFTQNGPGEKTPTFSSWYTSFPSQRNTLENVILNREIREKMVVILDRLLINKAQALIDQLIAVDQSMSPTIFNVIPNEQIYSQPRQVFIDFDKKLSSFLQRLSSFKNYGTYGTSPKETIEHYQAEALMLRDEMMVLYQDAPQAVKESRAKKWNNYVQRMFA